VSGPIVVQNDSWVRFVRASEAARDLCTLAETIRGSIALSMRQPSQCGLCYSKPLQGAKALIGLLEAELEREGVQP